MIETVKKIKDTALSKALLIALNTQIKEYGKMLKLTLDSTRKSIEMEVMLDGEHEPLKVHVRNYELSQKDGKHFFKVRGVTTSRTWINTVAASYLEGKAFELSSEYAKMLKVIV